MNLWQQYQTNKASKQGLYFPREGAAELGVSEGRLMADAPESVYLGGKENIRNIVLELRTLGQVQCVVRNSLCVHEKQGVYENVSFAPASGIALNIGGIDLRIFTARWHHALAVTVREGGKVSRSVQFYDEFGVAVQKVFLKEEGREAQWQALSAAFGKNRKPEFQSAAMPPPVEPAPLPAEKTAAFQERWNELKDIHHFGALLETFGLDRRAAYRHAPVGLTRRLEQGA
ncbi:MULTISPECIES: ChuX/HutX family heme-like substrate-binding protein [unclassified Neisseria]|uniref:ChuX/HutX family heme-like substrate-binding protein n=1 Tax=unclassified Neisseria TaxID=2623750 RepID=UPI001D16211C|nr:MULTISPECIES: ChuX/HutX family heme-like substrate-binding protein [unclassified Neisseria]